MRYFCASEIKAGAEGFATRKTNPLDLDIAFVLSFTKMIPVVITGLYLLKQI